MRIFVLFFGVILPVFAANLLTYNIYERSDRVDIMLSFDAPYEGNIFQKREKNTTSLILNSLSFEQMVSKDVNSKIFEQLSIEPKQNSLILGLKSQNPIIVNASKTTDGFGLRIRVTPRSASEVQNLPQASVSLQTAPNDTGAVVDSRYFIVLGVLFALVVFLYMFKKFITKARKNSPTKSSQNSMNWLFDKNTSDINIIYEKPLDKDNKLMLLSHENRRYLVIVGNSNLLLDRFGEDKIQNESDFAVFFEENKKKLGAFLQDRQNSLNSYKDKLDV
ncbi:hypothetical protein [Campylobacter suis]|uniref:Excinuclease ABC subunit A n=1 Tax=Campylobacter suis TaxID=2790657 RepID=A0ABM8Q0C0_9BACT|nr:hypothetical protein [Campylobacter suis]CAD7286250.1 hypothetical protein LMG8286_00081 [Campylobacter suis]